MVRYVKSLSPNVMYNKINGQIWYRNHADKIQLKEKENLNMVSVMESKKSEIQWKHWMMSFKILNKIYISACRTKISLIRDFNEKFGKEEQSIIDEDPNILNEIRL